MLEMLISDLKKSEIQAYLASKSTSRSLVNYSSKFTCKVSKKLLIPRGIKRELASSFYQLKLGHRYLKSYLYKLYLIPDNKCTCSSIETTIHLLLDCKVYKKPRAIMEKALKEELRINKLSLAQIFENKREIELLLVFLKETNICSKK